VWGKNFVLPFSLFKSFNSVFGTFVTAVNSHNSSTVLKFMWNG
jgi:hypothetical protein